LSTPKIFIASRRSMSYSSNITGLCQPFS
jgi:hypothetical protein